MRNLGYSAFAAVVAVSFFLLCGNPFGSSVLDLELQVGAREGRRSVTDFDILVNGIPVESEHEAGAAYRIHARGGLAPEGFIDVAIRRGDFDTAPVQVLLDPSALLKEGKRHVWRHVFQLARGQVRVTVIDGDGAPLEGVLLATAIDSLGYTDANGGIVLDVVDPVDVFPFFVDGVQFDPPERRVSATTPSALFQVRRVSTVIETPDAGVLYIDGARVQAFEAGGGLVLLPAGPGLAVFESDRGDCRPDSQQVAVLARERKAFRFDPRCGDEVFASTLTDAPRESAPPATRTGPGSSPGGETSRPVTQAPRETPRQTATETPRQTPRETPRQTPQEPETTRTSPRPQITPPVTPPPTAPPVRLQFHTTRAGDLVVNDQPITRLVPERPFAKSFPLGTRVQAQLVDIEGDCAHAPVLLNVDGGSRELRFTEFDCTPCEGGQSFNDDYIAALAFVQDHPECAHLAEVVAPSSAYGQEEYRELLSYQGRSFAARGRWEDAVNAFRESLAFGTDPRVGADLAICQTNRRRYAEAADALAVAERSAQLNGAPSEVWEVIRAYHVFVLHGQFKSSPPPTEEGRELYRNRICRAIATYEGRHRGGTNAALVRNVKALVCG